MFTDSASDNFADIEEDIHKHQLEPRETSHWSAAYRNMHFPVDDGGSLGILDLIDNQPLLCHSSYWPWFTLAIHV